MTNKALLCIQASAKNSLSRALWSFLLGQPVTDHIKMDLLTRLDALVGSAPLVICITGEQMSCRGISNSIFQWHSERTK